MNIDKYLPKSIKRLHGTDRAIALALTGAAIAAGSVFLLRRAQGGVRVSGAFMDLTDKLGISKEMDVQSAQQYLNHISNAGLTASGNLDDATQEAIKKFQRGNGIDETGQLDDETRAALAYMAAATSKNKNVRQMASVSPYLVAPAVTYSPYDMNAAAAKPATPVTYTTDPAMTAAAQPTQGYFTQMVAQSPQLGAPFTKTLKMSIKGAQRALNDLQNAALHLTGKLDHSTIAALQNFQSEQGLPATGHLNAETANALLYLAGTQFPDRAAAYHRTPGTRHVAGIQSTTMYDPRFHYSY